jgi:RHS repeat-associated protein
MFVRRRQRGRQQKKTVGSETTYYFYGVGGLLSEFTITNTGATQAASTDRATYRTSDKLGSAVLIMNSAGTVIENNRTLPYGEAWLPEVASTNEKKFTSYQRDAESGLDYADKRYYDSATARFYSVDTGPHPSSVPASLNRYVSNLNDPVNFTDCDGGCARTEIVSVTVGNVTYRTTTCFVFYAPSSIERNGSDPINDWFLEWMERQFDASTQGNGSAELVSIEPFEPITSGESFDMVQSRWNQLRGAIAADSGCRNFLNASGRTDAMDVLEVMDNVQLAVGTNCRRNQFGES